LLTLGLLAPGCTALAESCHLAITVPQDSPARTREAQQFIGQALCEGIEASLA